MQRWRLLAALGLACAVSAAARAADCDEHDPNAPMRSGQVTLTAGDAASDQRTELRSFVETGSLGRVEASVVSASPPGILRGVAAVPHLSRLMPDFGERLKGVEITAALAARDSSVRIVVRLRQVCAEHFRESFLSD